MLASDFGQEPPATPAYLQADESRGGLRRGAHHPTGQPTAPPRKTEGSTLPYATSKINLALKIGGGPTRGLPEVAFVLTKASLERGESGRWPWARSRDLRKSPVATASSESSATARNLSEHWTWTGRELVRHPFESNNININSSMFQVPHPGSGAGGLHSQPQPGAPQSQRLAPQPRRCTLLGGLHGGGSFPTKPGLLV